MTDHITEPEELAGDTGARLEALIASLQESLAAAEKRADLAEAALTERDRTIDTILNGASRAKPAAGTQAFRDRIKM